MSKKASTSLDSSDSSSRFFTAMPSSTRYMIFSAYDFMRKRMSRCDTGVNDSIVCTSDSSTP